MGPAFPAVLARIGHSVDLRKRFETDQGRVGGQRRIEVGDPVVLECGSRPSQVCPRGIGLASESAALPQKSHEQVIRAMPGVQTTTSQVDAWCAVHSAPSRRSRA
jgi:hypothetical protein